jgi:hypothetical protein
MRIAIVAAGLAAAGAALAGPPLPSLSGPFRFVVPEGWTDLGPQSLARAWQGVPPEVAAAARAHRYAAFAVDLRDREGGVATMMAMALPVARAVDDALLAKWASHAALQAAGAGDRLVERDRALVRIAGVRSGRLRFSRPQTDEVLEMYLLPGGGRLAQLVFACPSARHAAYAPVFEATARATTGLAAPPWRWPAWLTPALSGLGVSVAYVALRLLQRRLRAEPA